MDKSDVHFQISIIRDKQFDKTNCAVITPVEWIKTNFESKSFVRYLPPPHSVEDLKLIEDLVKNRIFPPPESWPAFKCESKALASLFINYYTIK